MDNSVDIVDNSMLTFSIASVFYVSGIQNVKYISVLPHNERVFWTYYV